MRNVAASAADTYVAVDICFLGKRDKIVLLFLYFAYSFVILRHLA